MAKALHHLATVSLRGHDGELAMLTYSGPGVNQRDSSNERKPFGACLIVVLSKQVIDNALNDKRLKNSERYYSKAGG